MLFGKGGSREMSLEERRTRANVRELQSMAEARASDIYFLNRQVADLIGIIKTIRGRLDVLERTVFENEAEK